MGAAQDAPSASHFRNRSSESALYYASGERTEVVGWMRGGAFLMISSLKEPAGVFPSSGESDGRPDHLSWIRGTVNYSSSSEENEPVAGQVLAIEVEHGHVAAHRSGGEAWGDLRPPNRDGLGCITREGRKSRLVCDPMPRRAGDTA